MKTIKQAWVVDDDPIFIFGISKFIKAEDFCDEFLVFSNGQEAFDHLKQIIVQKETIPEVILLDLNMPIMDGWQFLDELTKLNLEKQTNIYVLSSSIDPEDVKKVKKHPIVNNYIIKPIRREHLKQIKKEIIDSPQ